LDAVGSAVVALLDDIVRNPQEAPIVAGTRVQMASTTENAVDGERVPPLRLLYELGHSNDRIQLLTIQAAENGSEVPASISAQLQPLLGLVSHDLPEDPKG